MQISRRGSERDHGLASTTLTPRSISWSQKSEAVEVTAWFVPDFITPANHDWHIFVSPSELKAMIDAAASAIGSPASCKIIQELSPALTSLLRLATECSAHLASDKSTQEPGAEA